MKPSQASRTPFHEVQHCRQWWLWATVLGTSLLGIGLFAYGMIQQLILKQPFGDRPMSDTALAVVGLLTMFFLLGLDWLVWVTKLEVALDQEALQIRFFPFLRRQILFGEIRRCEARTYRPIREYGGWGIRFSTNGRAYTVSGNQGVQLELSDGKKLLIGSRRAQELAQAIQARLRRH